jgi:hypothetical protein
MENQAATPIQQPSPREVRIALVFTAAVLVAKLFLQAATPDVTRYDFRGIYTAGYMVRAGDGARLYDPVAQARAEQAVFGRPGLMVIVHPPFEALFFAPLAALSYRTAYLLWGLINILLWMWLARLARAFAPRPQQTFQYLLLCFAFFPLWINLLQGQTTLILLLLYSFVYLNLERGRDFRAGVLLGLGLFRFQLVLPFALICLVRRKWRMMTGFAAAALALVALSLVAVGPSGTISYVKLLLQVAREPARPAFAAILPSHMPTVRGVLSAVTAGRADPKAIFAAALFISLLLILGAAEPWRGRGRLEGTPFLNLSFASALAVTLLTAFHLLEHDLSLLLLPILLAIGSPPWPYQSPWRTLVIAAVAVLYLPPAYLLLRAWNSLYLLALPLFAFALAAFMLLRSQEEATPAGL